MGKKTKTQTKKEAIEDKKRHLIRTAGVSEAEFDKKLRAVNPKDKMLKVVAMDKFAKHRELIDWVRKLSKLTDKEIYDDGEKRLKKYEKKKQRL